MNLSIIFKLLSVILLTLTACFCISFAVEIIINSEHYHSANIAGWLACIAIGAATSLIFYMLSYKGDLRMYRREAMATIGLGWIAASLLGALPYLLLLPGCTFANALFESASGLTTTGASVFGDFSHKSPGLMFWRCMSQWIGGLGVVVFFVALLSFLGAGAKILYNNEASAQANELDVSRVQLGVWRIFVVYATLSTACLTGYKLAGMGWYDAIIHMFTTVSTGGFSAHEGSMATFNSPLIETICIVFMILGGTSFIAMIRMTHMRREDLRRFTEVYAYLAVLAVASIIIFLFLMRDAQWASSDMIDSLRDSAFQVVSIMTSTGYSTADYQLWAPITHVLLLCLMVLGGCTGSTAGGLKIVRFIVATKVCLRQIERSYRSRVVRPIKINGRVMEESTLEQGTTFLVLAGGILFFSTIIVAILEPQMSAAGTISATFATLLNIGPGLNEVGPSQNYGLLHDSTKIFLSVLMILGRIEFYALLALLMPGMWKRFN